MSRFRFFMTARLVGGVVLFLCIGSVPAWAGDCKMFRFDHPQTNASVQGTISVGGRHECSKDSHVWIVLSDGHGYFLQNPEVSLYADGKWEQDNTSLGGGIKSIIAVLVNEEGHKFFQNKVKKHEFGQFNDLPAGSTKLTSVRVSN